jgi:hypothetical protein
MSGASAQKSRTQRQARRLAADLAKGKMPASTVDLEDYLDRCRRSCHRGALADGLAGRCRRSRRRFSLAERTNASVGSRPAGWNGAREND